MDNVLAVPVTSLFYLELDWVSLVPKIFLFYFDENFADGIYCGLDALFFKSWNLPSGPFLMIMIIPHFDLSSIPEFCMELVIILLS